MPSLQLSDPISSSPAEQGKTPAELGLTITEFWPELFFNSATWEDFVFAWIFVEVTVVVLQFNYFIFSAFYHLEISHCSTSKICDP